MTEEQLGRLLTELENDRLEFKEELKATDAQEARQHVMRTVCAFYNTKGGIILFGVRDKTGEAVGLKNPQLTESGFSQQLSACMEGLEVDPKCEIVRYKGVHLFVVACPKGARPPYRIKGSSRPFVRVGSTNVEASDDQIAQMYRERSAEPQDKFPLPLASKEDINLEAAEQYIYSTSAAGVVMDSERALVAEGLLCVGMDGTSLPTIAGMLLFGRDPQRFLPHAVIKADVQLSDDQSWDDIQVISGNLFEQIKGAEAFVKRHIPVAAKVVGFRRVEMPAIPTEALREAIVNALVHRDYRDTAAEIHIRIRKDAVSIISPGGILPPLTIEVVLRGEFMPRTRNATIADVLVRLGQFMDKRGTGVGRMRHFMKEAALAEPQFEDEAGSFRVVFRAPIAKAKLPLEIKPQISEEEFSRLKLDAMHARILELVQEHGAVRARDVELVIKRSRPTVILKLSELVEKRVLERTTESRQDPNVAYRLHRRFTSPEKERDQVGQGSFGL